MVNGSRGDIEGAETLGGGGVGGLGVETNEAQRDR